MNYYPKITAEIVVSMIAFTVGIMCVKKAYRKGFTDGCVATFKDTKCHKCGNIDNRYFSLEHGACFWMALAFMCPRGPMDKAPAF